MSDGTGTRVGILMINKYRIKMTQKGLYNVRDSHDMGIGKIKRELCSDLNCLNIQPWSTYTIVTVRHWDPRPIQALGPVPYRPWAQAQQKGSVILRPSWSFLNVQTSLGYWIPRGDRLNGPGQVYEPCPGKSWYARETVLPNIIDQDGTKFQDHKCCTALSPKHPL